MTLYNFFIYSFALSTERTWFDYISLLIIPCIIYYVTNIETLILEWSATKCLSCASTRSSCNYIISHFQAETNWLCSAILNPFTRLNPSGSSGPSHRAKCSSAPSWKDPSAQEMKFIGSMRLIRVLVIQCPCFWRSPGPIQGRSGICLGPVVAFKLH